MQWESLAESQPVRSVEAHRPIYRSGTCCGLKKQQMYLKGSSAAPALWGKVGSALRIHTRSAGAWLSFSQVCHEHSLSPSALASSRQKGINLSWRRWLCSVSYLSCPFLSLPPCCIGICSSIFSTPFPGVTTSLGYWIYHGLVPNSKCLFLNGTVCTSLL